jgi:putative sigma-54 modulation protein
MKYYSNLKELKFTSAMKKYTENKLQKLGKYLDDISTGSVTLKREGKGIKLEISLEGVRSSKAGEDFYTLVLDVIEQLERQISKFREIDKSRRRKNFKEYIDHIKEEVIAQPKTAVREKFLILSPITENEAIQELEVLGHTFFVYKDIDRRKTCVVYKRNDGQYGLIVTTD